MTGSFDSKIRQAIRNPNQEIILVDENPGKKIKYRIKFDPSERARQTGERLLIKAEVSGDFIKKVQESEY